MTRRWVALAWRRLARPGRLARRWRADLRGATLVQFAAVLPVFVLVVIGLWSLFIVYSAQQSLCEAVWEASRYLQVEGPVFEDSVLYPQDWQDIALHIVNEELASNRVTKLGPLLPDDLEISPQSQRRSPQDMSEVTWDEVTNNWFFISAQAAITNPLGALVSGAGENNQLVIRCKGLGFFEGPPIGPTPGPQSANRPVKCPPVPPICTVGPPPLTPEPTLECPCRPH